MECGGIVMHVNRPPLYVRLVARAYALGGFDCVICKNRKYAMSMVKIDYMYF